MPYHCSKCGREWDDPGAEENAYTCTRACGGRLVSAGGEESPELTGLAERPLKIFLSYGHEPPEHVDVALRLKADLEARGHDVWFDLDKLKARSRWETEIERAIVTSDRVVVLMTPYSVRRADPTADAESPAARDGYCLNEVAKAYERNKNIVPIMLAWVDQGPPTSICSIQWLDMMDCVPIADRLAVYEQTRFPRLVEALEHGKLESEGGWAKIRRHLDPLDFHREMEKHIADFSGREWLLGRDGAMNRRFADEPDSRVFWILGDPGVGKSAIATQLAHRRGDVGAVHFCVHNNTDFIDSRAAVLSIAYQLATCLPAYQERLESLDLAAEAVKDTYTLFHNVIVLPLAALEKEAGFTPRRLLVVIDALDEATRDGRNEMAEFIAAHWDETPQWLRLVITSRKEVAVVSCLSAYRP
ncbi:MAG: TIR domain-containing protein, partial [Nitrospiraceae bacterium]|nr:TIR domain-containing protein [Nitrospiraceae bacterium]